MGKLFTTNTWRAPLQLIDCWLPTPSIRSTPAANEPLVTRAVQRFAKAGWLGRRVSGGTSIDPACAAAPVPASSLSRVRVLRQADVAPVHRSGVRLVISGRINDVCAELDRLVDQENRRAARVA
ncbi:hypothetical protein [Hydrogenophaga sp. BPS33]|uniref:hypothetical protein n=1 Tax=Hydrogenophaga sp. BPS33 TaxID=2651974 RepID=UPI00131F6264|nr:hypothetical protein [Hydrogenophaga sp. BPS33]QHE85966.1 hypothetical protein F9K07_14140 [Hydrogenophaga sp. BPS33]